MKFRKSNSAMHSLSRRSGLSPRSIGYLLIICSCVWFSYVPRPDFAFFSFGIVATAVFIVILVAIALSGRHNLSTFSSRLLIVFRLSRGDATLLFENISNSVNVVRLLSKSFIP